MPNQEWEIKPRATECKSCEKPFAADQVYVSSLRLNGAEYERADSCEDCWQKNPAGDSFSVWRGTFQPDLVPPEVLKKETAESLLRKLIEKNDPQCRNAIFILAVMLERRRILAEKDAQKKDDMTLIRVYEHRKTGETFIVSDPMLSLNQLEHVQAEVAALMAGSESLSATENKSAAAPAEGNKNQSTKAAPGDPGQPGISEKNA